MSWLGENWFTLLQSLAILSGFVFTCVTLRRDDASRRGATFFQLTAQHRELWSKVLEHPALERVTALDVDLVHNPISYQESLFVRFLILHLNSVFQGMGKGIVDAPEKLGPDIRTFLSLPIPDAVWRQAKWALDEAFVAFVESHRPAGSAAK